MNDELMAEALTTEYHHGTRVGRVLLAGLGCTDMTGAIRYFRRIDPGVRQIETSNSDGADTIYLRMENGDWIAVSAGQRHGILKASYVAEHC